VHYNQRSYIVREGEPLDAMLFITQGIIWNFTASDGKRSAEYIEKGSFYGKKLLDWGLECSVLPKLSELPTSLKTAKTHTMVEAFALMADDLRTIVFRCNVQAASVIQAAFRRFRKKKIENSLRPVEIESIGLLPQGERS
jgi:hypothetical protein